MIRLIKRIVAKRRLAADRAFRLSLLNRPHSIAARKGWATRRVPVGDRAGREPSRKRLGHTATIPSRGVVA